MREEMRGFGRKMRKGEGEAKRGACVDTHSPSLTHSMGRERLVSLKCDGIYVAQIGRPGQARLSESA